VQDCCTHSPCGDTLKLCNMAPVMSLGGSCCHGRPIPQHLQAHPSLRSSRPAAAPITSLPCALIPQQSTESLRPALRQVMRCSSFDVGGSSDTDLAARVTMAGSAGCSITGSYAMGWLHHSCRYHVALLTSREEHGRNMQRCAATESFAAVPEPPTAPQGFDKFVETLTTMFPIWVRT
jgi:hypothetical protein